MSRDVYDDLLAGDGALSALARAGQLRRAALELATEEMLDGRWVEDEEPPAAQPLRLAAQDDDRPYRGGRWTVRIDGAPGGGWTATQVGGPPGVTLEIDGHWIPLTPNVPAALPGDPPASLVLLDAAGGRWTLRR